jgi:hypothetical protein
MRELRDPGESGRAALLDTTANREDDDGDSELFGRSLYVPAVMCPAVRRGAGLPLVRSFTS